MDGFVEREIVSTIGGYDEGQSLRGFTRPINRIAQEFRDRGIVPESAIDVMRTVYNSASDFPAGWATGFSVPEVLIPLVLEWQGIRQMQALVELDPERVTEALEEINDVLGHDVNYQDREIDGYGRPEWHCSLCGSTFSFLGSGERWISPSGRAPCPRSADPP